MMRLSMLLNKLTIAMLSLVLKEGGFDMVNELLTRMVSLDKNQNDVTIKYLYCPALSLCVCDPHFGYLLLQKYNFTPV